MEEADVSELDKLRQDWNEGFVDIDLSSEVPVHPVIEAMPYDENVRAFQRESRMRSRMFAMKMFGVAVGCITFQVTVSILAKKLKEMDQS